MIGERQVQAYLDALHEEAPQMSPQACDTATTFTGIGGSQAASSGLDWPTRLFGHTGALRTSVVSDSDAPLLISAKALHRMRAIVDFGAAKIKIPSMGNHWMPLVRAANGHFLLPLFNFMDKPPSVWVAEQRQRARSQPERTVLSGPIATPALDIAVPEAFAASEQIDPRNIERDLGV